MTTNDLKVERFSLIIYLTVDEPSVVDNRLTNNETDLWCVDQIQTVVQSNIYQP